MKPHEWRWAIRDMPLDRAAKSVGHALAARMNGDNACWPSKARLAEDSGYSVRTVDTAVRKLEIVGLLKVRRRPPATNVYMARLPRNYCGVTPQSTTPHPATIAGEVLEERHEVRKPLTATAAASAITVDAEMLQLAREWIAGQLPFVGAHH